MGLAIDGGKHPVQKHQESDCTCMCVHMHVHGRVCQGGKEQRQEPFHTSAAKGEDLPQLHLYERLEAMEHFLGQEGSRILLRERGT